MAQFLVDVFTYYPYKKGVSVTKKASREAVAIKRAVNDFRNDPAIKGKRIKEVHVKCVRLI